MLVTELAPFCERIAHSACHLFILWLLDCICLSFLLVLGAVCGLIVSVPELLNIADEYFEQMFDAGNKKNSFC